MCHNISPVQNNSGTRGEKIEGKRRGEEVKGREGKREEWNEKREIMIREGT
jgi:hypothetical protein